MPIVIDESQYLFSKDVMTGASISRTTLWRWRRRQLIPQGKLLRGRQIVYTPDEFEQIKQHANRMEPARIDRLERGAGRNTSSRRATASQRKRA